MGYCVPRPAYLLHLPFFGLELDLFAGRAFVSSCTFGSFQAIFCFGRHDCPRVMETHKTEESASLRGGRESGTVGSMVPLLVVFHAAPPATGAHASSSAPLIYDIVQVAGA